MNLTHSSDSEFIRKLKEIVLQNLENEHFGVDELASLTGMGVNVLRHRLKILTQKTITQFMHEIRLNSARELLSDGALSVSETAWKTGFGSPEYFIRCFHDFYGYSPGEVKRRTDKEEEVNHLANGSPQPQSFPDEPGVPRLIKPAWRKLSFGLTSLVVVLTGILIYFILADFPAGRFKLENKSIAVLPFFNDTPEILNDYFINGITDMISNNLCKIPDVHIVPRSSTELYRGIRNKTTQKIAHELNARFMVEGSAQKSGDSVMVSVQLIDARKNIQLWAKNYLRKYEKFFILYEEIALEVTYVIKTNVAHEESN